MEDQEQEFDLDEFPGTPIVLRARLDHGYEMWLILPDLAEIEQPQAQEVQDSIGRRMHDCVNSHDTVANYQGNRAAPRMELYQVNYGDGVVYAVVAFDAIQAALEVGAYCEDVRPGYDLVVVSLPEASVVAKTRGAEIWSAYQNATKPGVLATLILTPEAAN